MKGLLIALATACCLAAAPAHAFDAASGRAAADRAAAAWAHDHQQGDGAFVDYVSGNPTYGYATMMLGYGVLRAGVREHDDAMIKSGFRAIGAVLHSKHPQRGVFDALVNATAYEWVLKNLPDDPSFLALKADWERYLRSIADPYIKSSNLKACTADPVCFHNHEVVAAFGDLQLLRTGLRSGVPGAKLADPAGLRAQAVRVVAEQIPRAIGHHASASFGGRTQRGLGLLSDTLTWPLAYHAFSTAILAGAAYDLGSGLPAPARRALVGGLGVLAGLMAPDGDVAYIGRRQQQAWALASAVYAGAVTARVPGMPARLSAQMRAVADRAFDRLVTVNRFGPGGIGAVPRPLSRRTRYHGVDANEVVPAALTIFFLNLAADAHTPGHAGTLPADSDGVFREPDKSGFVSVRHGDLWYVVHRRTITYDLRYDFGLVALKRRGSDGRWRDVMRPRPNSRGPSFNSAGPVIVLDGARYLPYASSIHVRRGGEVVMRGGYRTAYGHWLRPADATFTFKPVRGGVAATFPLRAGDDASMATYLPAGEARRRGRRTVFDSALTATVSGVRPAAIRFIDRGYASCCDKHLVAGTAELRPRRDVTVRYVVRARPVRPGAAPAPQRPSVPDRPQSGEGGGGGGSSALGIALGSISILLGATLLARHRMRRRRRARRRIPR